MGRILRWAYRKPPFRRLALHTSPVPYSRSDVPRDTKRVHPAVCESVRTWCELHGYPDCRVINAPQSSYVRRVPLTVEPEMHRYFTRRHMSVEMPGKYLARIPDAKLVGRPGLVVLPDGSFALEAVDHIDQLEAEAGYYRPLPRSSTKRRGASYSLIFRHAVDGNYYHWIHDVILRLYRVREGLPKDVQFIVPPDLKQYQYETLRLLDIHPEQLVRFDGRDVWQLEALYFSTRTSVSGVDSVEANTWFRDLVQHAYGIASRRRCRRILINRRLAKYWRIVNESEVERCLHAYGFETFTLETLSFREQVELFSEAEIVVAPHGAGLTNILFQAESIPVVDIFEPGHLDKAFWGMSQALGHRYWYFLGETVPNPGQAAADIRVPLSKLEATLQQIGL
jgi:capsular polysaccharide biosynthesis protein